MVSRVQPPGYSIGLKFRLPRLLVKDAFVVETGDVVQIARVTEIVAHGGREPAAFRQPDVAAPTRRVGRQGPAPSSDSRKGRQLLTARNDQPLADDRQISLRRQAGILSLAVVPVARRDVIATGVRPDGFSRRTAARG